MAREKNTAAAKGRKRPAWWVWLIVPLAIFGFGYDHFFVSSTDKQAYDAFISYAEFRLSEDALRCADQEPFDACVAARRPARAAKIVSRFRWDLTGAARAQAVRDVERLLQDAEPRMKVRARSSNVPPEGMHKA